MKTKPSKQWPAWTEARFFSFIRSALRRAFSRYPPRFEALKLARVPNEDGDKRTKWKYKCAECGCYFKQKDVQVDHRKPCGSLKKFEDLPRFCRRLFCRVEDLDVLCKPCHKMKTDEERLNRRLDNDVRTN